MDSYNGKTIISTTSHVFYNDNDYENFNIKITFNNNDVVELSNYKPTFSMSKEDICFLVCDYNLEETNNVKAIDFSPNE